MDRKPLDSLSEQPAPKPDPASSPAKKARRDEVNEEARVETTEPNTIVGLGEPDKDSEKDEGAASPDEKKERTEEDVSHVAIDTVAEETVVSEVKESAPLRIVADTVMSHEELVAHVADIAQRTFAEIKDGKCRIALVDGFVDEIECLEATDTLEKRDQRDAIESALFDACEAAQQRFQDVKNKRAECVNTADRLTREMQSNAAKTRATEQEFSDLEVEEKTFDYIYARVSQSCVSMERFELKQKMEASSRAAETARMQAEIADKDATIEKKAGECAAALAAHDAAIVQRDAQATLAAQKQERIAALFASLVHEMAPSP